MARCQSGTRPLSIHHVDGLVQDCSIPVANACSYFAIKSLKMPVPYGTWTFPSLCLQRQRHPVALGQQQTQCWLQSHTCLLWTFLGHPWFRILFSDQMTPFKRPRSSGEISQQCEWWYNNNYQLSLIIISYSNNNNDLQSMMISSKLTKYKRIPIVRSSLMSNFVTIYVKNSKTWQQKLFLITITMAKVKN